MVVSIAGKALLIWFGILLIAVANGILRERIFVPALGKSPGLVTSGVLLSGLILLVAYLSLPWLGRLPVAGYAGIGVGWLILTLVFEFTFALLIEGKPLPEILDAYTFRDGNIWPIVLLFTATAPFVAALLRGWV